ncbi:putative protein OS=Ureibacillus acetophenoni OX=614649 GN=SAMN05877842_10111 PE=4 SV=1 [Ureibacillus acetophenoni]|uniref:hypothetical protein n=1 Tax=Ureibacillus sp. MALMAid1270 TaxID=3411629 RepID=UPI003BA5C2A4
MQLGPWIAIVISAVIAFIVGTIYHQPLHWYLFILILFIGLFINTIILILRANDEQK